MGSYWLLAQPDDVFEVVSLRRVWLTDALGPNVAIDHEWTLRCHRRLAKVKLLWFRDHAIGTIWVRVEIDEVSWRQVHVLHL